jgi:hypothetical protein
VAKKYDGSQERKRGRPKIADSSGPSSRLTSPDKHRDGYLLYRLWATGPNAAGSFFAQTQTASVRLYPLQLTDRVTAQSARSQVDSSPSTDPAKRTPS